MVLWLKSMKYTEMWVTKSQNSGYLMPALSRCSSVAESRIPEFVSQKWFLSFTVHKNEWSHQTCSKFVHSGFVTLWWTRLFFWIFFFSTKKILLVKEFYILFRANLNIGNWILHSGMLLYMHHRNSKLFFHLAKFDNFKDEKISDYKTVLVSQSINLMEWKLFVLWDYEQLLRSVFLCFWGNFYLKCV